MVYWSGKYRNWKKMRIGEETSMTPDCRESRSDLISRLWRGVGNTLERGEHLGTYLYVARHMQTAVAVQVWRLVQLSIRPENH